jgi:hypothetical protein
LNSDSNLVASHTHDRDHNVVTDVQRFVVFAGQNEHVDLLRAAWTWECESKCNPWTVGVENSESCAKDGPKRFHFGRERSPRSVLSTVTAVWSGNPL